MKLARITGRFQLSGEPRTAGTEGSEMKSRIGLFGSVLVVMVFTVAGIAWARTFTMRATPVAPGATGTIDAKAEKAGGNTSVTVKVDHLARPTQLSPAANEYVVWIEPAEGTPQNVGALTVGDNEKGELKTTTTAPKFGVIVTAESDAHPKEPSKRIVLRADVAE